MLASFQIVARLWTLAKVCAATNAVLSDVAVVERQQLWGVTHMMRLPGWNSREALR
jgi:hypothetical protein